MFNCIWQEQNLSEYDIRLVCVEVVFAISVRVKEKGYDIKILDRKNVVESLNNIDTFDNLKKWFTELIIAVSNEIRQVNSDKKAGYVSKAKGYVAQNYANKITLEEVCKELFINPAYFSVAFKKATGKNFIDYVNEIRVEKSKELIIESEYRIKEIAQKVGFDSFSYFCTVFKRSTGATPLEFRSGVYCHMESNSEEHNMWDDIIEWKSQVKKNIFQILTDIDLFICSAAIFIGCGWNLVFSNQVVY